MEHHVNGVLKPPLGLRVWVGIFGGFLWHG